MDHQVKLKDTKGGNFFVRLLKKKPKVKKEQSGIYHYTFCTDTINEKSYGHKYNVYAKVKAVSVYDNMVEVEVVSLEMFESVNDNILKVIKDGFPKYIDPKFISWENIE